MNVDIFYSIFFEFPPGLLSAGLYLSLLQEHRTSPPLALVKHLPNFPLLLKLDREASLPHEFGFPLKVALDFASHSPNGSCTQLCL